MTTVDSTWASEATEITSFVLPLSGKEVKTRIYVYVYLYLLSGIILKLREMKIILTLRAPAGWLSML